jgi:hypothetical protein
MEDSQSSINLDSPTFKGGMGDKSVAPTKGPERLSRHEDPVYTLRSRQWAEYEKLCLELRLRHNSVMRHALCPDVEKDSPDSGAQQQHVKNAASSTMEDADDNDPSRSVHEYNFSGLYLGDKQLQPLAAALAIDRQLLAVFLPGIGMRDVGMISLCDQLKRSPTLECIDVSVNRFSLGGAEACLRLVSNAHHLVLVKRKDTCLEEEFCNRRGLPAKYAAVRKQIENALMERALTL